MNEEKVGLLTRVKGVFKKGISQIKLPRPGKSEDFEPGVNSNGLLAQQQQQKEQPTQDERQQDQVESSSAMVKSDSQGQRNEQLEKLQEGFNRLIGQLENINGNLSEQIQHQQKLIEHLDNLPEVFESLGPSIKSQQQLTEQMISELKNTAAKNQMFVEAVERIPTETAKQTDALESINHQLAAAADSDAQMAQSFSKFRQSIDKLDESTAGQTDSIMQMSKTFAASDRYLKYIISRDKKRMFWLLVISLGTCVAVILVLAGIILYLGR